MSNTPHLLADEFADNAPLMQALQEADAHFARLCTAYDTVNRAVHRAESRVEPMTEAEEQILRRDRARLKDEIARRLNG